MKKITKISMDVSAGTELETALQHAYVMSEMNDSATVEITFNGVLIGVNQSDKHDDDTKRDKYLSDRQQYYYDELDRRERVREAQERSLIVPVADVLTLVELAQVSQKRGRWLDAEIRQASKIVGKMPTEYQAKFRSTMELPFKDVTK